MLPGVKFLQSAEVEIVELQRRAQTGSDGLFRFGDVPDGAYTLRTQYVGAPAVETKVNVSGDTRSEDILLGTARHRWRLYRRTCCVVGQQASIASALSRQRSADGVESVLSRDGIGQFPDQNAAESLRRVAGINVLNDQGEGRFVAVRGLSPDLNAASINGARVPAPEAGCTLGRAGRDSGRADRIHRDQEVADARIWMATPSARPSKSTPPARFDRKEPFLSFSGEGRSTT